MSEPDVVAELTHWTNQGVCPPLQLIRRARDEIVALRRLLTVGSDLRREARAEALEEAARMCEHMEDPVQNMEWRVARRACAAAIRALKDKR